MRTEITIKFFMNDYCPPNPDPQMEAQKLDQIKMDVRGLYIQPPCGYCGSVVLETRKVEVLEE